MIKHSALSEDKPPKTLYKYVSQDGLIRIFNSQTIWATDIFYMNDAAEYNHAVYLMQKQIEQRLRKYEEPCLGLISALYPVKPADDSKRDKKYMEQFFLGFIREAIGKLTNFHIFVCSFTNQRDLLSQWRGYCAQGIGFSIGFKTSLLKEVFEKKNYQLVKCIYDTDKQLKLIDALLQDSLDKIPQEEVDDSKVQEVVHPTINEFIRAFFQLAPMFKDSSFHEESEWRFISRPVPFGNGDLRYRQGLSMIIPYAEIDLQTEGNLIPVKNIVIGPTQQPELSKMSIKSLLINKGIENFSISLSKIPYREW